MRETEATKEDPDPNGARTRPTLEDQHDGPVVTLKLTQQLTGQMRLMSVEDAN